MYDTNMMDIRKVDLHQYRAIFNGLKVWRVSSQIYVSTIKLGNKEQIGIKEPFPVTNLPFTS